MQIPEAVYRAEALATAMRFKLSSIREVGRLLAMLAAQRPRGRFAEIGAGCGVGTAWIASALGPEAAFVTVETDAERAAAVARLFDDQPRVRVLHGDWHELLPAEAPFDLLFFDGGAWKRGDVNAESEAVLELVAPAGVVVIDDLTPEALWPEEWRGKADPVRDFWLGDPRLRAAELLTTPATAAIVATKNPANRHKTESLVRGIIPRTTGVTRTRDRRRRQPDYNERRGRGQACGARPLFEDRRSGRPGAY